MSSNDKRMTVWSLGLAGLVAVFGLVTGCPGTDLGDTGQVSPEEEEAADAGGEVFGLVTGCPGTDLGDTGQVSPEEEEAADAGGEVMAGVSAMAQALFVRITETEPFEQWAQFADFEGTQVSVLPHGPMSQVYINEQVEAALANFTGALPDDSIIVKQNIGESNSVTEAVLTVMWKVAGFDPDNNDWFWVNVSLEGEFTSQGRVEGCVNCHAGARPNDFVFVHQF